MSYSLLPFFLLIITSSVWAGETTSNDSDYEGPTVYYTTMETGDSQWVGNTFVRCMGSAAIQASSPRESEKTDEFVVNDCNCEYRNFSPSQQYIITYYSGRTGSRVWTNQHFKTLDECVASAQVKDECRDSRGH